MEGLVGYNNKYWIFKRLVLYSRSKYTLPEAIISFKTLRNCSNSIDIENCSSTHYSIDCKECHDTQCSKGCYGIYNSKGCLNAYEVRNVYDIYDEILLRYIELEQKSIESVNIVIDD